MNYNNEPLYKREYCYLFNFAKFGFHVIVETYKDTNLLRNVSESKIVDHDICYVHTYRKSVVTIYDLTSLVSLCKVRVISKEFSRKEIGFL